VEVDDRLSINTLDNARALIQKVGFTNSEYYVFNAGTQKKMAKITLGEAVPFLRAPQQLSKRFMHPVSGLT